MSNQDTHSSLMNRSINSPNKITDINSALAQSRLAQQMLSMRSDMMAIATMGAAQLQDNKKRRKRRRKPARPTDTRNIISPDVLNTIWRMTRFHEVEGGGLVDFDDAERNKLLEYAILQYYLGYDEGKYNVLYQDGQLTVLEVTRDASRSNTQGNEVGGGISLGKESSVSVDGKVTDSTTRNSGDSLRATLDQSKRNEMIATANKLTDMREQLIRLMDNKVRVVLAPKPKGIYKSRIHQVHYHIDKIGQWTRILARKFGESAATSANPQ